MQTYGTRTQKCQQNALKTKRPSLRKQTKNQDSRKAWGKMQIRCKAGAKRNEMCQFWYSRFTSCIFLALFFWFCFAFSSSFSRILIFCLVFRGKAFSFQYFCSCYRLMGRAWWPLSMPWRLRSWPSMALLVVERTGNCPIFDTAFRMNHEQPWAILQYHKLRCKFLQMGASSRKTPPLYILHRDLQSRNSGQHGRSQVDGGEETHSIQRLRR